MSTSAVYRGNGNDHNPKRCRRIQDFGTLLAEGVGHIPRRNACAAADRGKDGAHKYLQNVPDQGRGERKPIAEREGHADMRNKERPAF